ncbi:MAG: cation:proton antiporter [Gemmatimonadales bacterium]
MTRRLPWVWLAVICTPVALVSVLGGASADNLFIVRLFGILPAILIVGKLAGEAFERMGQPSVLGELIAGALLGPSLLGLIPTAAADPMTEVIRIFAEIGVVVLLFEIGLETDLRQMARVGPGAAVVALVGVALPFAIGFLYWASPLVTEDFNVAHNATTAIFIGAALTATSVGITARVLADLRVMGSVESQLIIGAAVLDDVLGLVILGVVAGLVSGDTVTVWSVLRMLAVAVGFLVVAITVGLRIAPRLFTVIDRMRVRGILLVSAFAFTLFVAWLAHAAGSAMIIGAFAAGIILSGTNQFDAIEERIKPVADIFTPIFFVSIGAQLDVRLLNPAVPANRPILLIGLALFLIAVVGKLAAGFAVPWRRFNRWAVGFGMVPRGEVGLIFAQIGLTAGVLSPQIFSAVLLMVIGTTFVAPPLLKWSFARGGVTATDESRSLEEHHGPPSS